MTKTIAVKDIASGDLLVWSKSKHSSVSNFIIRIVAKATGSDYGHVGIAWRFTDELYFGQENELFVVEATIPTIQVARVTQERHFYCVPAQVVWRKENKAFLVDKLGLPYGYLDALRAGFGKRSRDDDTWQCAELAHAFYRESGLVLPEAYRPADIVNNVMQLTGNDIYRVLI